MPTLFWLALLLGYLAGVAAAVLLLPARLIAPLIGPLALTTVIALAAFGVLFRLRRARRRARQAETAASLLADPPADHRLPANDDRRADRGWPANLDQPTDWDPPPDPDRPADADRPADWDRPADPAGPPAAAVGAEAPDPHQEPRWPLLVRLEPPGVLGPRELQEVLAEGRVDVRLRPIASLEQPDAALYHVLPRLHALDDSHLAPARYRSTAARCGLLGLIDQRLLGRAADLLRETRAEGRAVLMVCEVARESLTNPAFRAELERLTDDDPELAGHLVLGLEQSVRDLPAAAALAELRALGIRFCLRRVGPPTLDAAAIGAGGFDFVLLEAARFALGTPDGQIDPALRELQRAFGRAGPMLLVGRVGFDEKTMTLPGDWALSADDGAFDLARPHAA